MKIMLRGRGKRVRRRGSGEEDEEEGEKEGEEEGEEEGEGESDDENKIIDDDGSLFSFPLSLFFCI